MAEKYTRGQWIEKFKAVHGDEYDYSVFELNGNSKSNVSFICKLHGVQTQVIHNHTSGKKCRQCMYEARRLPDEEVKRRLEQKRKRLLRPARLYVVELENDIGERFFKVGVCSVDYITKRFTPHRDLKLLRIIQTCVGVKEDLLELEDLILEEIKERKFKPSKIFGGHTECFSGYMPASFNLKSTPLSKSLSQV